MAPETVLVEEERMHLIAASLSSFLEKQHGTTQQLRGSRVLTTLSLWSEETMPQTFWNLPPYAFVPLTSQRTGGTGEKVMCQVNGGAGMGLSQEHRYWP